jgi:hypothetical protein
VEAGGHVRSALAGLLVAMVGLAGCADAGVSTARQPGDPTPAEPPAAAATATTSTPEPTPAATPTSTPTKAPTPRDKLAEAAEQQATETPKATPSARPTEPAFSGPVLGADMSWPQCPKGMGIPEKRSKGAPLPLADARYVVVGLTNGPGFVANPCLADQVAWVREHELLAAAYAVASYPDQDTVARYATDGPFDGGTRLGALANTGFQQARFNVASMVDARLRSPIVWIDVEPVPDFEWSTDQAANAAVVRGVARGYTDAGYRIGFYSTPYLWSQLVGDLAFGAPEWRAAGETSRAEATRRCGDDWVIQGGSAVLGQWVEAGRDQNVTCPGVHRDLTPWFHAY